MRILAYNTSTEQNKLVVTESTGESCHTDSLDTIFGFLLEPYNETIKVTWCMDETVAPILRLLGEENCRVLHQTKKLHYPPFSIFYIPNKVFSVRHIPTKLQCNLYDLAQYYPELEQPETLAEVQVLGQYLIEQLKLMGMQPTKLSSPVAIYEECVLQHLDLPKLLDIPKEVTSFALQCAGKLWIEAYQLGSFGTTYDYDIVSSFPSIAIELLDIRKCQWIQSKEFVKRAIYGYAKCRVTITAEVSPIIYINKQGESSTPIGTWETYLTKSELEFIEDWQIGSYEILDGYWALPKDKLTIPKPLEVPLQRLLKYRESTGLKSILAKRMSVGVYGKLGEERADSFGPYANPIWFAEISTQVRLQVAEFIYQHKLQEHLIHTSVDGVLVDCEVKL